MENPQAHGDEVKPSGFARFVGIAVALVALVGGKLLADSDLGGYVFGGVFGGALCGAIPYFIAKKRHPDRASLVIWSCVIAGALLGWIGAAPVAIGFVIYLFSKAPVTQNEQAAEPAAASDRTASVTASRAAQRIQRSKR